MALQINEFKITDAIRQLSKDRQPLLNKEENNEFSKYLINNGCIYLLSKIKENEKYNLFLKMYQTSNENTIKMRFKHTREVFKILNEKKIPYAVIKGAVLSQEAYGKIYYRKSGDIDLLTNRSYITEIKKVLTDNGFIQGKIIDNNIVPYNREEIIFHTANTHQSAPFIKKIDNKHCPFINIDINNDIMWGEYKALNSEKTDMDYILNKTVLTSIIDGIEVKKLSVDMELISLCLHHYKDMNSIYLLFNGSLKLSLFCDIYFYIINNYDKLIVPDFIKECEALRVSPYIYYCIYYSNIIFKDEKLYPFIYALKSEKGEKLLNCFGLNESERREWSVSFYDRLFNENFNEMFIKQLTEDYIEKIKINNKMMQ